MAQIGKGFAISIGSFSGEILGLRWTGAHRDSIDTGHSAITDYRKTFLPGPIDMGAYEVELLWDSADDPPIDADPGSVTITWPKKTGESTACTHAFTGFCTDYDGGGSWDDKLTGSMTIKVSGDITITPGS